MSVIIWIIIGAVFLFALQIYINKAYTKKHLQKQIGHINQNPLTGTDTIAHFWSDINVLPW